MVRNNLDVTLLVDEIPLAKDAQGTYRVGGTRVTLDLVVRAFNRGATAEEIVQKYDNLRLPDVYQVIGYYLKHADEDRKSTRLNSSHQIISYAVFCLKKKQCPLIATTSPISITNALPISPVSSVMWLS